MTTRAQRLDLPAVSLFSNCGAGDIGFARAGFEFEVIAEIDAQRIEVARLNHPTATAVPGDLRDTYAEVVREYRRRRRRRRPALLAACPPCQGMSSARSGRGLESDADAGSRDHRNLLVDVVASVASELRPRIVVVENVLAFLSRKVRHPDTKHPISAARLLVERLDSSYEHYALQCDLADYGVPQTRKRSFLVLIDRDEPAVEWLASRAHAPFPAASHGPGTSRSRVTLHDALVDLGAPPLDAACPSTSGSGMHAIPTWDQRRYRLVASIPANSGKGAWSNDSCPVCGRVDVGPEDAVCPRCGGPLTRPVVEEDGVYRLVRGFKTSSYTRMQPDMPAATVTTASGSSGSDKTLHPWENRVLSPRECAHLQTFPKSFRWGDALEQFGQTNVRAMIGEAVPPQFTERHGRVLADLITGNTRRRLLPSSDRRIDVALRRLGDGSA